MGSVLRHSPRPTASKLGESHATRDNQSAEQLHNLQNLQNFQRNPETFENRSKHFTTFKGIPEPSNIFGNALEAKKIIEETRTRCRWGADGVPTGCRRGAYEVPTRCLRGAYGVQKLKKTKFPSQVPTPLRGADEVPTWCLLGAYEVPDEVHSSECSFYFSIFLKHFTDIFFFL